ncbi:MAG TPA: hypothetical protein VFB25_07780 [Gaiellaceae bacterium]|nr:hypothetical protein [Gaiellaceae bacterium]
MRRLVLTLVCALIAVPAAVAATRSPGDGVFELNDVYGNVVIGLNQPARGAAWGQMAHGILRATDPTGPTDGTVLVSGYESRHVIPATDTTPRMVVYAGDGIHFRVTGGKYRLSFTGADINLTAVGVGVAQLTGDPKADDPGQWSKDSGAWQEVPVSTDPAAPAIVSFGTQPTTTGP